MWEKMPQEGNRHELLKPFYNGETQFLRFFVAEVTADSAAVSIQHLQHIARLRLSLTMAAHLISDRLSGKRYIHNCSDSLHWLAVK